MTLPNGNSPSYVNKPTVKNREGSKAQVLNFLARVSGMDPRPGWDPEVDILKLKRLLNLRNQIFKKLRNWSEGLGSHQKVKKCETLAQKRKFLNIGEGCTCMPALRAAATRRCRGSW